MGVNRRERKEAEREKISRRKFLKKCAVGAGAAAAVGVGVWRPWSLRPLPDKWAFLEREVDVKLPGGTWRYATENYVPVSPEVEFTDEAAGFGELIQIKMPFINREAEKRGWPNGIKVGLIGTWQYYGRPEKARFAEPYREYVEKCMKYLYSRIPRLAKVPLELIVIKNGQDFSKVKKGRGFIGYSFHDVQRLHVDNNKKGEEREEFFVGLSINERGSLGREKYDENWKREVYLAVFGPGPTALGSTFSEVIPLAVSEASFSHLKKFGHKRSRIASEAFSEGVSDILTSEMIEELNIPRGFEINREVQKNMAKLPKYVLVPASRAWLRKNGIDKGLELYMEDPEKYLAAIQS